MYTYVYIYAISIYPSIYLSLSIDLGSIPSVLPCFQAALFDMCGAAADEAKRIYMYMYIHLYLYTYMCAYISVYVFNYIHIYRSQADSEPPASQTALCDMCGAPADEAKRKYIYMYMYIYIFVYKLIYVCIYICYMLYAICRSMYRFLQLHISSQFAPPPSFLPGGALRHVRRTCRRGQARAAAGRAEQGNQQKLTF